MFVSVKYHELFIYDCRRDLVTMFDQVADLMLPKAGEMEQSFTFKWIQTILDSTFFLDIRQTRDSETISRCAMDQAHD